MGGRSSSSSLSEGLLAGFNGFTGSLPAAPGVLIQRIFFTPWISAASAAAFFSGSSACSSARVRSARRQRLFLSLETFDDQHHLAFATVFIFLHPRHQLTNRRAMDRLGFGQLTSQHHIAGFSQYRADILQTLTRRWVDS